ncbi:endogenous retrovirus group 3 member 1 Env polyprotein-like [Solea solea]|uniref:endogenous retrovirus group 3 member 1 Env polyprotein-like n=1 Tax=Solea solea TaxID=90069 RepID=UPI00272B063F|nr:endogenous retrovirus group 3 member 1 Env polyprotein-like [Solea solea]
MLLILQVLVLIRVESIMATPQVMKAQDNRADNINVFLTMAWQVGKLFHPNSSCYVCSVMPYTAGQGLPLMALPMSDCDTCRLMHIRLSQSSACPSISKMRPLSCSKGNCNRCTETPKPVPILVIPQRFTWCLENDGERPVGYSDCLHTFKWGPGHTYNKFKSPNSLPQQCLEAAGQTRLSILARHSASCSVSSPEGMYWVCGNLAYPYLPVDYKGRCGLAHVVPAMRVAHSLPQKAPLKRTRRGVSDIFGTHSQSPFKNALGPLLPFYGVMSALDQISDLSRALEVIANETGKALTLLSHELASVRLLALQNRAALDFLLAAQGGTCAVIGSECCTFVPDYSANISDIVSHLHDTAKAVHQDSSSISDWLSNIFGPMSYHIVEVLVILAVFIVLFSLFMSCMKRFLCNI